MEAEATRIHCGCSPVLRSRTHTTIAPSLPATYPICPQKASSAWSALLARLVEAGILRRSFGTFELGPHADALPSAPAARDVMAPAPAAVAGERLADAEPVVARTVSPPAAMQVCGHRRNPTRATSRADGRRGERG